MKLDMSSLFLFRVIRGGRLLSVLRMCALLVAPFSMLEDGIPSASVGEGSPVVSSPACSVVSESVGEGELSEKHFHHDITDLRSHEEM